MSETLEGFRDVDPTLKGTPFVYSSKELKIQGGISVKQCLLTQLLAINSSSNLRYFQVFESAPQTGDIPAFVVQMPAGGQLSWQPTQGGRVFAKLYWAVSTTLATYTASTDTFWVDAEGAYL